LTFVDTGYSLEHLSWSQHEFEGPQPGSHSTAVVSWRSTVVALAASTGCSGSSSVAATSAAAAGAMARALALVRAGDAEGHFVNVL
jgi:hypothetical protein